MQYISFLQSAFVDSAGLCICMHSQDQYMIVRSWQECPPAVSSSLPGSQGARFTSECHAFLLQASPFCSRGSSASSPYAPTCLFLLRLFPLRSHYDLNRVWTLLSQDLAPEVSSINNLTTTH